MADKIGVRVLERMSRGFLRFFWGERREWGRGYVDKMDRRRGEMVRVKRGGDVFRM